MPHQIVIKSDYDDSTDKRAELEARRRALSLASRGADLDVIRQARRLDRPSNLLAPTMTIDTAAAMPGKMSATVPQELLAVEFHAAGETVHTCGSGGWVLSYEVFDHCKGVGALRAADSQINQFKFFDSTSRVLTAADKGQVSTSDISKCKIVNRHKAKGKIQHQNGILSCATWGNETAASGCRGGRVLIWDDRIGTEAAAFHLGNQKCEGVERKGFGLGSIETLEWGADGRSLAVGTGKGLIAILDMRMEGSGVIGMFGRESEIVGRLENPTMEKRFSNDKEDGILPVYQRSSRGILERLMTYPSDGFPEGLPRITSLVTSPTRNYMASLSQDGRVLLWRLGGLNPGFTSELPNGPSFNFEKCRQRSAWRHCGDFLAVASADRNVYVFSHMKRLAVVDFFKNSPDDVKNDPRVKICQDKIEPKLSSILSGHSSVVTDVAWHPTQPILASCGLDHKIILGEIVLV